MPGPGTKWIRELNRDPYYCSPLEPEARPQAPSPDPQSPMPNRSFDAFPEQAAAIPIRRAGRALQICVIRRKDANRWGIPKGLVDPGDTHEETALNEAWEEAGINGRLLGAAIGTYRYRKWGTRLTVAVYVMEVLEQAETLGRVGVPPAALGALRGSRRAPGRPSGGAAPRPGAHARDRRPVPARLTTLIPGGKVRCYRRRSVCARQPARKATNGARCGRLMGRESGPASTSPRNS